MYQKSQFFDDILEQIRVIIHLLKTKSHRKERPSRDQRQIPFRASSRCSNLILT